MKTIQEFFREVNTSIDPTDDALYKKMTNERMDALLRTKSDMNHILVLGTGNMQDISLDFFLGWFTTITLSDIDIESTKEALGIDKSQKHIRLKQIDYLGLQEIAFFKQFDHLLLNASTTKEVENIIQHKINQIITYQFSKKLNEQYDAVYCCPIYTQLLYWQASMVIQELLGKGLSDELASVARNTLLQRMKDVLDHFNQELKNLVRKDGLIFLASDIFALEENAFSRRIVDSIHSNALMERIHDEYLKEYGFGLGDYGLLSASNLFEELDNQWFLWKQSKHQTYAVNFRAFEKIDE